MVAPDDLAEAFGPASRRWLAVTVPIPGDGFVIIMNDTHAPTRQNATLMEEFFHIVGGDGFMLSPIYCPGAIEEFVDLVVPELQRRGLFRTDYSGVTQRDHLRQVD